MATCSFPTGPFHSIHVDRLRATEQKDVGTELNTELNTKNSNEHRNRTKEHGLVALVKLNRAIAELTGDYALKGNS